MSSIICRVGLRATRLFRDPEIQFSKNVPLIWKRMIHKDNNNESFKHEVKKDPELYPLWLLVAAVYVGVGWRFGQFPFRADYTKVAEVPHSEPWEDESTLGEYKYYIRGNPINGIKDAPSALNVTIVPNVTLPKELHDKFNKLGKPEWDT